jgi:hypothetical protein
MPTSLINTGVQFPDNSIQTTAATGGGGYALNAYTSPATWSKPTGLKAVKVTVQGAGGSGANSVSAGRSGGGGGGGGTAIEYIPAPSIPGPVSVTAGPGTNSFGPFCSATAGGNSGSVAGASGGAGSGGNINITGGTGGGGSPFGNYPGGMGGASLLGNAGGMGATAAAGTAGQGYGAGGGGGGSNSSPGVINGAAGSAGIVIVEEFY